MSSQDKELEKLAYDAFPFLFSEWNAEIIESRYEQRVFGNGFVVIRAANVLVRIVRDRNVLSVEIGPLNADLGDWFDLERVVQILHGLTIGWPISEGRVNDLGRVLRENLPDIMSGFASERFATTKARLQAALENARRPPDESDCR